MPDLFAACRHANAESSAAFLQPAHCRAFNFHVIQRFKGKAFFMTKNLLAEEGFCGRRRARIRFLSGCCEFVCSIDAALADLRQIRRLPENRRPISKIITAPAYRGGEIFMT